MHVESNIQYIALVNVCMQSWHVFFTQFINDLADTNTSASVAQRHANQHFQPTEQLLGINTAADEIFWRLLLQHLEAVPLRNIFFCVWFVVFLSFVFATAASCFLTFLFFVWFLFFLFCVLVPLFLLCLACHCQRFILKLCRCAVFFATANAASWSWPTASEICSCGGNNPRFKSKKVK